MNRTILFGGSAAVFGAIVIADHVLTAVVYDVSFATVFGVFAGALALAGGLNVLRRYDEACGIVDSVVAYVLALGTVGLLVQTILQWI